MTLSGCAILNGDDKEKVDVEESGNINDSDESIFENAIYEKRELEPPNKERVLSMREKVLENMSEDEVQRLTDIIKMANLVLENANLNENLLNKLEDKNNLYWNYFDKTGEIQIGRSYEGDIPIEERMKEEGLTEEEVYSLYGTIVIAYNNYDAKAFADLIREMKNTVTNIDLQNDLQQVIDEAEAAAETHEVEHVEKIYKLLHDMDYYLLRYAPEDVGPYVDDKSTIMKYYGALTVYNS